MATKTVTGKLTRPGGGVIKGATVVAKISGSAVIASTQEIAPLEETTTTATDGTWSLTLQANADLLPNDTYYTFKVGSLFERTAIVPPTAGPFKLEDIAATIPPTNIPLNGHVASLLVDGAVTFSAGPFSVPAAVLPESAISGLVADLASKATDSLAAHLAGGETFTGVKDNANGAKFDTTALIFAPPPSGGDDSGVLQPFLDTLRVAGVGTLVLGTGTYLTSVHLIVGGGTKIMGSGAAMQGGTTVKLMNSSNLTGPGGIEGVFVPYEWVNNNTLCGNPFIIENVKVDANKANNGSGQACGIIVYNFWSHVRDNYIANTNLYGVLATNTGRDGTTFLTNTASENRIYRNHFSATGSDAIRTIQGGAGVGANLDGYCDDNTIDSPIGSGIKLDAAAGWSIRRNHGYGIKQHFIYAPKCFATVIAHNDTDDYGLEATGAQTYYGIYATSVPGAKPSRGGHIHDNALDCTEAGASSTYHYYWVEDAGVTGTAQMTIHDNNGRYSGAGTSIGFLLTLKASAATWIYEEHNNVGLNLATGRRVLITSTGQVRRRPPLPSSPPASNQYLTTPFNNVTTIQITTLNAMYLVPVDVSVEQTFTGIWLSLSVVGTGAGSVARLGIYGDDGTFGAPAGSVIEDVGTVDMLATTGDKGATFAVARKLLPARYWLAVVVQVALTVGPTLNSANGGQAIALPQANVGAAQGRVWTMAGVTGALPALSGLSSASISPLLALKAQ